MKIICFDCGCNDWMKRFYWEGNRSFCEKCHKKRKQNLSDHFVSENNGLKNSNSKKETN